MSPTTAHVLTRTIDSPVGPLFLAASDAGLHAVEFAEHRHPVPRGDDWREGAHPVLDATAQQLDDYFAGTRRAFDLPFAARGTPFQQQVWSALTRIPYGATASYVELARMVDKPSASRAVGAANGRNPLSIVVPCHRVIGASGALTGFGGGLPTKEFLLTLEGAWPRGARLL
ncbi:Methylated-DNA--protein-cysteine methyltransferase [Luteimonas sp. 9C]|uniref:methylated-DNA--[protein]-cysteine S-methyltransferase n=1 Tax=Luteimonas sp. 9C TaxID=2653148 RepID=UPI0012EF0C2B|nr:methylated-DNA--[protein]-cysteine S-methyltransferase [Luteimonas sp. 9C]VXB87058.1 Methylated-DNA--protein-cysteine methyltransferase [Luteimonas sp. 9C]